jgi:peptidyl-tRNA hydrolase, PTH1 family
VEISLAEATGPVAGGVRSGVAIELVVGLGNPGAEYAASRHNVGFRVVEELARRFGAGRWRRLGPSLVISATCGRPVVLAQPQTFMNCSGTAVWSLCTALSLPPQSLLVVADDVDLPIGRLRLRPSGGAGTHNGLRDVVAAIGAAFPRLRVGVRGDEPWQDLADYVLAPFLTAEEEVVSATVVRAADAAVATIVDGLDAAMNRFNRAPAPPSTDPAPPHG